MIAKAFKIEKGTVDTYNKRILKKAENIFWPPLWRCQECSSLFKTGRITIKKLISPYDGYNNI